MEAQGSATNMSTVVPHSTIKPTLRKTGDTTAYFRAKSGKSLLRWQSSVSGECMYLYRYLRTMNRNYGYEKGI